MVNHYRCFSFFYNFIEVLYIMSTLNLNFLFWDYLYYIKGLDYYGYQGFKDFIIGQYRLVYFLLICIYGQYIQLL